MFAAGDCSPSAAELKKLPEIFEKHCVVEGPVHGGRIFTTNECISTTIVAKALLFTANETIFYPHFYDSLVTCICWRKY